MTKDNPLQNFGEELVNLVEKYQHTLPPYEIVNRLVCDATTISMACAPNEVVGLKTVIASVENGIAEYEENYS